jgi:hypothetical protein
VSASDDRRDDDVIVTDGAFTWVEIEVQKAQQVHSYRGRMRTADIERWRSGEPVRGCFTVDCVYWVHEAEDGREHATVVGWTPGLFAGATGTLYVRADLVVSILTMRDGSEWEMLRHLPEGES